MSTPSRRSFETPGSLRIAVLGLLVNASLALVKLITGIVGHSYALIADAVESLADIFGSIVVWGGVRLAAEPPDENHPYGHGKAEALAAMVVAMMLVGAAVGIAIQAVREILDPGRAPAAYTLLVLLLVIALKETMYQLARRTGTRESRQALIADAWHHRSDAITSLAAAIGIGVALVGGEGYESADAWAALFASVIILVNAGRLARAPFRELMDTEPAHITAAAREIALALPDVRDVEKSMARQSGGRFWVDMHIEVDPDMSVRRSHAVAHEVKDAIRARLPRVFEVLIHIEPHGQRGAPDSRGGSGQLPS